MEKLAKFVIISIAYIWRREIIFLLSVNKDLKSVLGYFLLMRRQTFVNNLSMKKILKKKTLSISRYLRLYISFKISHKTKRKGSYCRRSRI